MIVQADDVPVSRQSVDEVVKRLEAKVIKDFEDFMARHRVVHLGYE